MTLEEKTTHATEAKAKLIEQFRGKPGFEGLLDSYLAQIQELEGVFFDLLTIVTDLDSQTGAQLDLIGRIVGEERKGKTDAVYLQAIKARLIINRASGTVDETRLMLSQIVANEIGIEEYYPAAFVVRLLDAYAGNVQELAYLIEEIRAAGVNGCLETSSEDDADTFTLADGDSEEEGDNGFGGEDLEIINSSFDDWTAGSPDDWTLYQFGDGLVDEVGSGEGAGGSGTGSINFSSTGSNWARVRQTLTTVPGRYYAISLVISYLPSGTLDFLSTGLFAEAFTSPGTYQVSFMAAGSSTLIELGVGMHGAAEDATVDSLAVLVGGVWAAVTGA